MLAYLSMDPISISPRTRMSSVVAFIFVIFLYLHYFSEPSLPSSPHTLNRYPGWVAESLRRSEKAWTASVAKRDLVLAELRAEGGKGVQAFGDYQRTIWDYFPPVYTCPHVQERIGKLGEGGKFICGIDAIAKAKDCVVYSFGVNTESSFEADLLDRAPNCKLWAYDFSVAKLGPEIVETGSTSVRARSTFHSFGLAGKDSEEGEHPRMYTLKSLMKQNGHQYIDVLKIDIEGWEFEVMESLFKTYPIGMPFGQLLLEVHAPANGKAGLPGRQLDGDYLVEWFERLEQIGHLRVMFNELNYAAAYTTRRPSFIEYGFINVKSNENVLLRD